MLGDIILYLIIGLIAGGIAGYLVPGRTPGGLIGTILVGIAGALIGGWLMDVLFDAENLNWLGSVVVAVIGAVIVLFALRKANVS